jgi:hypothetical protein
MSELDPQLRNRFDEYARATLCLAPLPDAIVMPYFPKHGG